MTDLLPNPVSIGDLGGEPREQRDLLRRGPALPGEVHDPGPLVALEERSQLVAELCIVAADRLDESRALFNPARRRVVLCG
jgi:hypothetical protein